MKRKKTQPGSICNYYVDESGDGILFNRRGQLLLHNSDCRKFFILGLLKVEDPLALSNDLESLRSNLLNDPYFSDIPSMQPKARKTALFFHAKDDIPEARREVFEVLLQHDMSLFAVVKSMWAVYHYVSSRNLTDTSYRYRPDELYELTVRRLFKERLHKEDHYIIHFSRRGSNLRSKKLIEQLHEAKERYCKDKEITSKSRIEVVLQNSYEEAGLQAVDYFLWALHRLYERREERFIKFVWDKVSLIRDVDDTREDKYGVYYTKKKPPSLATLPPDGFRI